MTTVPQVQPGLVLTGLDGANPLAFLAALGTLRGLTIAWPERRVRLSWRRLDAWRPVVHADGLTLTPDLVLDGLDQFFQMRPGHEALDIADNLSRVSAALLRERAQSASLKGPQIQERAAADFLAAFGCDAVADDTGVIRDTALRTLSGAGHQDFLKTMRDLRDATKRDDVARCLFAPWRRENLRLSLRWDPEDDRRYALQWKDPSSGATQTEWGANRLAFEALPLLPTAPAPRRIGTTGFSGRGSRDTFWTWPIWDIPVDLDTVRSLLALRSLQDDPPARTGLGVMGIREVYRSQRLTIGKFRNFTPAQSV